MIQIALRIIETVFAVKKDKAGKPYIDHLRRVAGNAKNYFKGNEYIEELETIALLHDLPEDFPEWTNEHLMAIFHNINIVTAIDLLTKKDGIDYEQYIFNIRNNKFARAVKLADLRDNMDLTRLPKLTEDDIHRIKKYHQAYIYLLGDNNNH